MPSAYGATVEPPSRFGDSRTAHHVRRSEPNPVPVPVFETLIIRGVALAWPSRFDRSAS